MSNGNETKALAVRPAGPMALETLEDLARFGKVLYESGLFPDVKSQAQAIVKILAGQEIGLPMMESMTKINVVEGKVQFSADLMARIIKRDAERGGYDYHVVRLDNEACEIRFSCRGQALDPTSTFTMKDAERAKLAGKFNYQQHPRNMLFARALTNGAKVHCPHLFGPAASVAGVSTDVDDDGEVVMSAPTPPTEQQVVTEAARNTAPLTVPRAASSRYHTEQPAAVVVEHVPAEAAEPEPVEPVEDAVEAVQPEPPPFLADMPDRLRLPLQAAAQGINATPMPDWSEGALTQNLERIRRAMAAKRFTEPDFYGLLCSLHLALTGEVLPTHQAPDLVDGRYIIWLSGKDAQSEYPILLEVAQWWRLQQKEV